MGFKGIQNVSLDLKVNMRLERKMFKEECPLEKNCRPLPMIVGRLFSPAGPTTQK